jgi:[acyl-carrier-protein] S-malonyltransferase
MTTLAFVFPGQGSQTVGMLNGFSSNPVVAQAMD